MEFVVETLDILYVEYSRHCITGLSNSIVETPLLLRGSIRQLISGFL